MTDTPKTVDINTMSDAVIEKLKTLQKKKYESSGFIKGDNLTQVTRGWPTSVTIDVFPEEFPDETLEFHTHPASKPQREEWQNDEDFKCELDSNSILSNIPSHQDVINHILRRNPIGMKSIIVTDDNLIQYGVFDEKKFKKFLNSVKLMYGNRFSENVIADEIMKNFIKFYEEETAKYYDKKQDFSTCADKKVYEGLSKKWETFLESIGMELKRRKI